MSEHARLSPSDECWPYCAGSPREQAKYVDVSGDVAIDGTGSHILLELCHQQNVPASDLDGTIIGANHHDKPTGWLVDLERCKRVQICLDYITRRKEELKKQFPGCEIIVHSESKSNPGLFSNRDDWWGTCDITIKVLLNGETVFLEVIDYKDGRGYVSEKWSTQLISYLFGKLIEIDGIDQPVPDIGMRMTIVQPKTGTPIRYMCSTNPDHGLNKLNLMQKVTWLFNSAHATDDPDAVLTSGKHCLWCSHNPKRGGTCTTLTKKSIGVIETMTTDLSVLNVVDNDHGLLDLMVAAVSDIKSITPENLAKLADVKPGFDAVFSKVMEEIEERIKSGVPVSGYAWSPGNAKKVWNQPADVIEKKLKAKKFKKDQIFPSKLITPAAALKLPMTEIQKAKLLKELISEVVGENTLKKVEYDTNPVKDTAQMFMGVGEPPKEQEPPSFF